MLSASSMTLPLFAGLSACKGRGPAVLNGPPPVSGQTAMLLHAVTAEQNLVWLYTKAIAAYSALTPALGPILAEHEAHLARLRSRVIEPPGKKVPGTVTARPPVAPTRAAAVAQLRSAEQAAVKTLLRRLGGASPSLAQLYASIAASEATHVATLDGQLARPGEQAS